MKSIKRGLVIGAVGLFLVIFPGAGGAQEASTDSGAQAVITLLKEQNKKMSSDLRRIQREIAALRADLDKPGVKDVFAGIGYIFGLFGVAAYFTSRKKN